MEKKILYELGMRSLIYAMVCPKSRSAYMVGLISMFLANPGKQYWTIVKWILH